MAVRAFFGSYFSALFAIVALAAFAPGAFYTVSRLPGRIRSCSTGNQIFLCLAGAYMSSVSQRIAVFTSYLFFIFLQCYFSRTFRPQIYHPEVVALISITSLISFIPVTILGIGNLPGWEWYIFFHAWGRVGTGNRVFIHFFHFLLYFKRSGYVGDGLNYIVRTRKVFTVALRGLRDFYPYFFAFSYFLFPEEKIFQAIVRLVRFTPYDRASILAVE